MRKCAVPTAVAVAAAVLAVPCATPAVADAGQQCSITVESGTLDWGVKQSFRGYIAGPIAHGNWKTSGAVTENGKDKTGKDFYFQFQVDPAKSTITVDESGNITAADIHTQDAAVDFEGHKGALASHIGSPYLTTTGTDAKIGINYRGYYVKGKGMTEYKPEDRIPENLVQGTDYMAGGTAVATVDGENVTLRATDVTYQPKPGTNRSEGIIEGVDVVFLGLYGADYKPEIDDVNVTLKTKNTCGSTHSQKPAAPETPRPDRQEDKKDEKPAVSSELSTAWNWILGIAGLVGMFGVIGKIIQQSGLLDGVRGLFNTLRREAV